MHGLERPCHIKLHQYRIFRKRVAIYENSNNSTAGETLDVPATPKDHGLGPVDAPVTLIEYGDYECNDCFNAEPVVSELRDRLGDKLRVVFRHFPRSSIHPRASAAAAAAEAAAVQGQFWKMHKALFQHQRELGELDLTYLALQLGLEVYRFQQSLESVAIARRIRSDFDDATRNYVTGTPTFFINNRRYRGPAQVDPLLAALTAEINRS
ncbi:MAG TPA: DsbA family protein [Tepidisphaeraceae bacterium]|nr:DsbA family protein [Tepidisphaeraceae bacterium]